MSRNHSFIDWYVGQLSVPSNTVINRALNTIRYLWGKLTKKPQSYFQERLIPRRRVWMPVWIWIIVMLGYGICQILYESSVKSDHYNVPVVITIISVLAMLIIAACCIIFEFYVQSQYVDTKPMRSHTRSKIIGWSIAGCLLLPIFIRKIGSTALGLKLTKASSGANQNAINHMMEHPSSMIWIVFMMMFIGPTVEEFIFRFLMIGPSNLNGHRYSRIGRAVMITLSSTFFIYEHLAPQLETMNWSSISIEQTCLLALAYLAPTIILAYDYIHTNDIRISLYTHIGDDALVCVLLLIQFYGS